MKASLRSFLSPLALAALASQALAAPVTKSPTGTDLSDGASWGGTAPTALDIATWTSTSLGTGLTLEAPASWLGAAISGALSDIGLSGSGQITLGTSGIDMSTASVSATLGNPVDLGASQSWRVASGRTLAVSGSVSGTGALTLGSAAPVANYSGFLSADSGAPTLAFPGVSLASVLTAGGTMAGGWIVGTMSTTTYHFTNNGTIATYQLQFYDGTYTKVAKVQLTQTGGDVTAYQVYAKYKGGNWLGSNFDSLAVDGSPPAGSGGYGVNASNAQTGPAPSGVVLLSGSNSYTGATTIVSGTLRAGSTSAFGTDSAFTVSNTSGATLDLNGFNNSIGSITGAGSLGGTINLGSATLTVGTNNTSPAAFAGNINGVGGTLLKTGTGTLTLGLAGGTFSNLVVSSGVATTNNGNLGVNATVTLGDTNTAGANVQFASTGASVSRPITVSAEGTGTATIGSTGGTSNAAMAGVITLNRPTTMTAGSTDRTTWTGKITGNVGTLTVAGGKRTVFESAFGLNDFVGDVVVTGTSTVLQIGAGTLSGENLPNTSSVTVESGAFLKLANVGGGIETIDALNGSGTVRRHEGVGGTQTLVVGAGGGNGSFSGVLQNGAGLLALTKSGAGTQTLTGTNTYSGVTTINGGTLKLGTGGSINDTTAITVAAGATFDVADTGFTLTAGKILVAGDSAPGDDVIGALTSSGTIRPGGVGTLGTISGLTNLTLGGTLNWDRSANSNTSDSFTITGTLTISPGFTINPFVVGFPTAGVKTYTVVGGLFTPLTATDLANLPALPTDYAWDTSDPTALKITYNQPGANLFWDGGLSGTWDIGVSANWAGPAGFQNGDFATLDDTATGTTTIDIPANVTPTAVQVNNSTAKDYTIGSSAAAGITGSSSLIKTGDGLLVLTAANTNTGGTLLTEGVIAFGNGGLSTLGPITLNGGTLRWDGTNTQDISSALAMVAGKTAILDTNGNNVNLANGIGSSANASLTKIGAGNLTLNGTGTWTGTTEVLAGRLSAGSNTAFGTTSLVIGNGAADAELMLSNRSDVSNNITVSASGTGAVTIGADNTGAGLNAATYLGQVTLNRATTFSSSVPSDRMAIDGKITGNVGTLTVTGGSRTTFLATTSDFVGDLVITGAGTVLQASVATAAEVIPDATNVTVGAGAILQLASLSGAETINVLSGGGTVRTYVDQANPAVVYGSVLAVGGADGSGTFAGTLVDGDGALGLSKVGTGTQTLGGFNTYTGNTTVNAGTLVLADDAALTFRVTDLGCNRLSGAGNVTLDGNFAINVAAVTVTTGTWLLEDVATLTGAYGPTFQCVTPTGIPWTDAGSEKWTRTEGTRFFVFDETTGTLTVSLSGYVVWANANAPGQTIDQDHDGDGVPNGIEYFMGESGSGFTALPSPDAGGTIIWTKSAGYEGTYGAHYKVQTSTDLAVWTDVPAGQVTVGTTSVQYTLPEDDPAHFARLRVTGP